MKTQLPNFTYQIELASGEVEKHIVTKQQIKEFLNGLYGGSTPDGLFGFDVTKGVLFDNLPKLQRTKLMSDEMLDWYAEEYARNGIHGSRKPTRSCLSLFLYTEAPCLHGSSFDHMAKSEA